MKSLIPAAAFQQHVIALGKTGAGKSSAMRSGFVEPLLDQSEPICILDPKGDWWGLKSSANGQRPGYAVVIFGGPHADVPINEHSGTHVAELFATGNRPCIIDLSDFTVGERTRFFMAFASTLYRKNRGKKWLVMDECHNFAPQGKVLDVDSGKALHWANKLASEGRGRGLNLIAASQRPQKVHKDFLTSMETLVAMRVIHNLDRNAIKDWIDGAPDKAIGKEILDQLASMKRGEGWVWSPEINFGPKLIVFPMFKTYDSFKPQEADTGQLAGWASVDLDEVREKLSGLVAEQQANDPKLLRKRIAELESLAKVPGADQAIDEARQAGWEAGYERGKTEGYRDAKATYSKLATDKAQEAESLLKRLSNHANEMALQVCMMEIPEPPANKLVPFDEMTKHLATISKSPRSSPKRVGRDGHIETPMAKKFTQMIGEANAIVATRKLISTNAALPKGEAAILGACIQYPDGLERSQLTVLTGYKKSARDSYISRLSSKGYLSVAGRIRATPAGIAALPNFAPLPTGRALREYWMERLPTGERLILEELIKHYPDMVSRDLLENTGYKKSARDSYLSRLAAKNLAEPKGPGYVRASDDLF